MKSFGVRASIALIVASIMVFGGVATSASAAPQDDVVTLANQQRYSAGLPALTRDATLDAAAQEWAQTMSNARNMVHSTNEWRAARIPAGWYTNGENIAYGYGSASAVMSGWMNSKGHKENILRSNFTHIGVGYVASGNYWVQIFAGYDSAKAPAIGPAGAVDDVSISPGAGQAVISARGWAFDPVFKTTSIDVHVYITDPNGTRTGYAIPAREQRIDVAASFSGVGSAHGYSFQRAVSAPGDYQVCVYGIAVPRANSTNSTLGCRSVSYAPGQPIGNVEQLEVGVLDGVPTLQVRGWALDNASRSTATEAHVYVFDPTGKPIGTAIKTDIQRPDVAAAFPGAGPTHGFAFSRPLTQAGKYTVCVYSISAPQFGSSNRQLACREVKLGPSALVGAFDVAEYRPASKELAISGWSIDLGLPSMVSATHVYVTAPSGVSTGYALSSNGSRPDVGRAFVSAGPTHGFTTNVPVAQPGSYRVCAYAISNPLLGAGNILLGCKTAVAG